MYYEYSRYSNILVFAAAKHLFVVLSCIVLRNFCNLLNFRTRDPTSGFGFTFFRHGNYFCSGIHIGAAALCEWEKKKREKKKSNIFFTTVGTSYFPIYSKYYFALCKRKYVRAYFCETSGK